jgi:hypothetical protein
MSHIKSACGGTGETIKMLARKATLKIPHEEIMVLRQFYKSLTHSRSSALLEKPPIVQLLKNFPGFYATKRFITVFTRALHHPYPEPH